MTREERPKFCKVCENKRMSLQEGLICNINGTAADFDESCPHFKEDAQAKQEIAAHEEYNALVRDAANTGKRFNPEPKFVISKKLSLMLILLLATSPLFAQTIEGKVTNANTKEPLLYVNVSFPKENYGTITNDDGAFRLKLKVAPQANDTIVFSMVGFQTESYTYSELVKHNFSVSLSEKIEQIGEVKVSSKRLLNDFIPYRKLPPLPFEVYSFGSVLADGKIYIIAGDESYREDPEIKALELMNLKQQASIVDFKQNFTWEHFTGKLQCYDIEKNVWTTPDIEFIPRAYHSCCYCNGKIYVLGGKTISTNRYFEYLENKIEVFDVEKQTITIDETNPHQAINFQLFDYKNSIIVMGGSVKLQSNGFKKYTNKAHLYDLSSGYWYELTDMPTAKETKGVRIGNTIYLIGGENEIALDEIDCYNLTTGIWQTEGTLFEGIRKPALTTLNKMIYIYNNDKILTYNTETKVLNEYNIKLNLHNAELFYYSGKLYIVGGSVKENFSESATKNMYCIDLSEFRKTKITHSRKFGGM